MKYIGILICSILFSSTACQAQVQESYWVAVSSHKINREPMRGITLSYMEMLTKAYPYLAVNGNDILIPYPDVKRVQKQEFTSFTNTRIKLLNNSLLDSIYGIKAGKDTLCINFYYQGTGDEDKKFVLNYIPISKADYEKATAALKQERGKVLESRLPWDATELDFNKSRPLYLQDMETMDLINPMQLADELTQSSNKTAIVYQSALLSKNDSLHRFKTFGIQNRQLSESAAAKIGNSSFDNLEFYVDANKHNQGMGLRQKKMPKNTITEVFNKISNQFPSAKLNYFGLPKKFEDGDISGIHINIALTWQADGKVIKLVVEGVPDALFDKEVDRDIAVKDDQNAVQIKQVFAHYLTLIDQADLRVFVMSKDFDELLNRKENRKESRLPGQLWEYVTSWKYLYDLDE
ncbi:hypothetical protein [Sphingobacterium sp. UBA7625]|uniref:hypothetical protein n=1 Tax=Sphingobacterium sp. UBA7625 TaxID=1947522 RepID=UPI00257C6B91|nr:hypothetical protein [Sphingobacterium sp. UBA7625]